jgi:hypothetical protein
MRISRHDLRRSYSNSLVIDAGSHFTLRACSQANKHIEDIILIIKEELDQFY